MTRGWRQTAQRPLQVFTPKGTRLCEFLIEDHNPSIVSRRQWRKHSRGLEIWPPLCALLYPDCQLQQVSTAGVIDAYTDIGVLQIAHVAGVLENARESGASTFVCYCSQQFPFCTLSYSD